MIFFHSFFVGMRFFFAAVLLAAFSFHVTIFDHHHDERIFVGIFQAVTHGEEKKWFTDILPASARMFVRVPMLVFIFIFFVPSIFFVYDPIRQALRRGVIHPKLYI
jgi:hypothetical protein